MEWEMTHFRIKPKIANHNTRLFLTHTSSNIMFWEFLKLESCIDDENSQTPTQSESTKEKHGIRSTWMSSGFAILSKYQKAIMEVNLKTEKKN